MSYIIFFIVQGNGIPKFFENDILDQWLKSLYFKVKKSRVCNFKLNSKIKENSASIWFQHLILISYYSSKNKKDNYISLDERNTVKSDQLLFRERKPHRLNENMISLHTTLGKSGWNHLVGLVWTLGWHTLHLNHLIFSFSFKLFDVMQATNPSQVQTSILELKAGFYQFKQIHWFIQARKVNVGPSYLPWMIQITG